MMSSWRGVGHATNSVTSGCRGLIVATTYTDVRLITNIDKTGVKPLHSSYSPRFQNTQVQHKTFQFQIWRRLVGKFLCFNTASAPHFVGTCRRALIRWSTSHSETYTTGPVDCSLLLISRDDLFFLLAFITFVQQILLNASRRYQHNGKHFLVAHWR